MELDMDVEEQLEDIESSLNEAVSAALVALWAGWSLRWWEEKDYDLNVIKSEDWMMGVSACAHN